jgi:hypothetical protein
MVVPREPNSLATPSFYKPTRESSHYQLSIDFSCASDRFGEHPSAATIALDVALMNTLVVHPMNH